MKYNVFIDGAEGTTGLKIHQYFQKRDDIQLLNIDTDKRKDLDARLALIKQADISFLCLPDAVAREIAAVAPEECRILDTSTGIRYGGTLQRSERKNQGQQPCSGAWMPRDRRDPADETASGGRTSAERLSSSGIFFDGLQRRRQEDDRSV